MLEWGYGVQLEYALNDYVSNNLLIPGIQNVGNRPGSYVVIIREYADQTGNYNREFYCETWMSPNQVYRIVYSADNDCCYIEYGGGAKKAELV